jgi:hypothetical protein
MIKLIIAAAALALGGCAALMKPLPDSAYTWHHGGKEALPMTVHQAKQADVQAMCGNAKGFVMACAMRNYEEKTCKVYTALKTMPTALYEHEKRHCDGWEHNVI